MIGLSNNKIILIPPSILKNKMYINIFKLNFLNINH